MGKYICGQKYIVKFTNAVNQNTLISFAKTLFNKNEQIRLIQIFAGFLLIHFYKSVSLNKLQNDVLLKFEFNVEKYTRNFNVPKKTLDFFERDAEQQPLQLPNHIVCYQHGYRQIPVVKYVLELMLCSMKCHSEKRTHQFSMEIAKIKLMEAFLNLNSDFACKCGRCDCQEIIQLFGKNSISPDRVFDELSYIHSNQQIKFVVKSHNTLMKFDDEKMIPLKRKIFWCERLADTMKFSTRRRVEVLRNKRVQSVKDKEQISKFDSDPRNLQPANTDLINMLKQKKFEQRDLCAKCERVMYFGNEEGMFEYKNVGNKVSPDRIDNENIFYDADNVKLVCISCNYVENRRGRSMIEHPVVNDPIDLTKDLLKECILWLQK